MPYDRETVLTISAIQEALTVSRADLLVAGERHTGEVSRHPGQMQTIGFSMLAFTSPTRTYFVVRASQPSAWRIALRMKIKSRGLLASPNSDTPESTCISRSLML